MSAKPSPRLTSDSDRSAAPAKRGSLRWVREVLGRSLRLEQTRQTTQPSSADPRTQSPPTLVIQQRAELGARLLVHDPATQVVRHLFLVHDELRAGGWAAVEALPTALVGRAAAEAELLAIDEPSHLLGTIIDALRAIELAARVRAERAERNAREALEAQWDLPKVPEVSDTNFDEYELMERSWAGTVPAGLREASHDTR
jgi:hypothetical protein